MFARKELLMKKQSTIRLLTILLSVSLLTGLVGCNAHSRSEDLGENKDTESYIKRTYPEEISRPMKAPIMNSVVFWKRKEILSDFWNYLKS